MRRLAEMICLEKVIQLDESSDFILYICIALIKSGLGGTDVDIHPHTNTPLDAKILFKHNVIDLS
jgi:hypothetical protein